MSDAPELACFYKSKLHNFGTNSKWDFRGNETCGDDYFFSAARLLRVRIRKAVVVYS
jgi:hypothetical protein